MVATCLIALAATTFGQTSSLTYATTFNTDLRFPGRLAPAGAGEVYVTDQVSGQVIHYDVGGGVVATYAIPALPVGIAVHPDGRIFVSRLDGAVGIYDASFSLLGVLDPSPFTLEAPNDIAIASDTGDVYVADSEAHRVVVFDGTTGLLLRLWGIEGSGPSQFQSPQALALDEGLGRVIVMDVDNSRAQVFNTSGVRQFTFGYRTLYSGGTEVAWFARGEGVAVDSCHNIYITDALMGTIRVFDRRGHEIDPGFVPPVTYGTAPGQLRTPCDVMIAGGRLFAASTGNAAVEVYDLACTSLMRATADEGPKDAPHVSSEGGSRTWGAAVNTLRYVDNPLDIVAAMRAGTSPENLDVNADGTVDRTDLGIVVERFGAGSVDGFLAVRNTAVDEYPYPLQPPHMIDLPFFCGRCHSMDGAPGGMLTAAGQENLCISCHTVGGRAMEEPIGNAEHGNSHPWGVPASSAEVAGPAAGTDMTLHLDSGNIRCGTCHEPHEQTFGTPYLRADNTDGGLCKKCHRGEEAPIDHADSPTEHCNDCHDTHSASNNLHLVKAQFGADGILFTDASVGVGPGAFVVPDPNVKGICEACHAYPSDNPAITPPHTLDSSMPVCTTCHLHKHGFEPGLDMQALAAQGFTTYMGAGTCAVCHADVHATWDGTKHPDAQATLAGIGQGANAACLGCHTVGFGETGGYVDMGTTPGLAGVQCENCHGMATTHVGEPRLTQPDVDYASSMCGTCHTTSHHPTYDEWSTTAHVTSATDSHGSASCRVCHEPMVDLGAPPAAETPPGSGHYEGLGVECGACHDPHAATGNSPSAPVGHDYQLRYTEVMDPLPAPSNDLTVMQDPNRYNLCGRCHRTRNASWTGTSRPTHHSIQVNHYLGEMPVPTGTANLVPFTASDHANVPGQCTGCHMHKAPFDAGPPEVPANTGHTWAVNYEACVSCHGSAEAAESLAESIKAAVEARLANIHDALELLNPATTNEWEYTSNGGPSNQGSIPEAYKKTRWLYYWVQYDGSFGAHNGPYTEAILQAAETLMGIDTGSAVFMSAETCAACHTQMHTDWEATLHAEAWATLNGIGMGANGTCLPCHTVGFGQPHGFVDGATTPKLAGVQCENCHGAGHLHILNPNNTANQPEVSYASSMCGTCHTTAHHPTYDEWSTTAHVTSATDSHGSASCRVCHEPMGAFGAPYSVETPPGSGHYEGLGVECGACHDPHKRTNNAAAPDPGRDYQLRVAEYVAPPNPSSLLADVQNPARFNICGACHHARSTVWTATSRGPHHSNQANVINGEMPMPAGQEGTPLVPNADPADSDTRPHAFAAAQCSTCHMQREEYQEGPPEVPAVTGHAMEVSYVGCNTAPGCHSSSAAAEGALLATQGDVDSRVAGIIARLSANPPAGAGVAPPSDPALWWEYSLCSGTNPNKVCVGVPEAADCTATPGCTFSQSNVPPEVKKVRFMIKYMEGDGSRGGHNAAYAASMLTECEDLLTSILR